VSGGPKQVVAGLWSALSQRDWDGVAAVLADDCIYYDVPVGPAAAARGPRDVVARLRVGLDQLAEYENFEGRMVAEGDTVMYEHSERWGWTTGETVVLPFVTVHQVREGRISLWADYWDYGTLLRAAPQTWQDSLATADLSWIYDATGQV
jgi:limonene-1,2-epoxide hydrolase